MSSMRLYPGKYRYDGYVKSEAKQISESAPPLYNCYRLQTMASDSSSSSSYAKSVLSGRKGSKKVRTGCITCKYVSEDFTGIVNLEGTNKLTIVS